jgi:signal recognition particle subunit SRP54
MRRMEGLICAMTPKERRSPDILNASRRKRIAAGSGVTVTEVNTMLNKFYEMQKMMKNMGKLQKMIAKMGGGSMAKMMGQ